MTAAPDRPQPAAPAIAAWVGGRLRPMDKLEVHRRGLRHPAVSVFVLRGREVLVQRRAAGKYHTPGLWANACCTHPHWGEDPALCATRRLAEELGIAGLPVVPAGRVAYRAAVGGGMIEHEVVEVFTARAPAGLRLAPDPAEVAETDWVEFDALRTAVRQEPARFTPWLRLYLTEHAARLFPGMA